jgi:two-component system NtrC family sensor kinase
VGRTGEAYIINGQGVFQTRRRSGGDLLEKDPDAPRYPMASVGSRPVVLEDAADKEYMVVTSWIKDHQWLLVVRQARDDAFQELRKARMLVVLISFFGGLMLLATALYMSGRIVSRIKKVDQEMVSLDQQLVMAGRLAEIGEMSSGFAHEINNPLQIIRAETSLIEMILPDLAKRSNISDTEDFTDISDSVRQIQLQVERCADITASILKFARKKNASPEKTDLAVFVPQVVRMVAKKAEVEGVQLTQDIPEEASFFVNADPSQFQQVLLNLINNAMYAVAARHGCSGKGSVTVSVRHRDSKVTVAVADNGNGIAPENMEKIFAPFFSTKPVGHGTGLGLSICYGIINKMGGTIEVKSEQDKGAVFTVILPESA